MLGSSFPGATKPPTEMSPRRNTITVAEKTRGLCMPETRDVWPVRDFSQRLILLVKDADRSYGSENRVNCPSV